MITNDVVIAMTGSGGDGIVTIGDFIVSSCASEGLYALSLKSFGPQIRGGESSSIIHISDKSIGTQGDSINILTIFAWKDYKRFNSEMLFKDGLIVLVEEKEDDNDCLINPNIKKHIIKVPFTELAKQAKAPKSKNIVMMGIIETLLHISKEGMLRAVKSKFINKGNKIVEDAQRAFEAGEEWVKNNIDKFKDVDLPELKMEKSEKKMIMTGNEALAFGALCSGCTFFSGYPITPSSEVLEWASREFPKFDGVFIQAEDEISAIGIATGASYGGKKVLTSTSGPGLSLMTETIGLATIAEIPLVIIDVQRGGPSTGLPTKMEQSDLLFAISGSHGDSPRVVLAPINVRDCFYVANKAFYISEKYQIPVIILSDQFIGGRLESINPIKLDEIKNYERIAPKKEELGVGKYKRYSLDTPNGVSPMATIGLEGGQHYISGLEHDEFGRPTSETSLHEIMSEKRYRKFEEIRKESKFYHYGDDNAKIGIIGWGSTNGPIMEAIDRAENEGLSVKGLVPEMLYPLKFDVYEKFIKGLDTLIVAEVSFSAQFFKLLRINFDLPENTIRLKRAGGVPFYIDEIYSKLREVI
jgi:2-oxoglutarate/2-oxoacid ferredoxin oxidoreductase subunit alpha